MLLLIVLFFSSCKLWHPASFTSETYAIKSTTIPASSIDSLILPYKKQLDGRMNTVIGQSALTLERGKPESTLGNWFADVMYAEASMHYKDSLDFAFQNYGGIRISSIPKGDITIGKIYELMPFENTIAVIELDSSTVHQLCNMIAARKGSPVSRHIQFGIKNKDAVNIKINNVPLHAGKIYHVVTNNYIANGGDRCDFLIDKKRTALDIKLRDAIIEFIQGKTATGEQIKAEITNRIYFITE